jgi:hypothetical protein
MRSFGLIALLVVLLIVAWLSTRQVAFVQGPLPPASTEATPVPTSVGEQSQQIQRQVIQEINKAMDQSRRNMPDDAR